MDKIVWHEGMLLRPQHFQQHDRYLQHQLQFRSQHQLRHNWGFYSLTLDPHHLAVGKIVVTQAKGLMPDGTLFELDQGSDSLIWEASTDTADKLIYLSLPVSSSNLPESRRQDDKHITTRFLAYDRQVNDSNAQTHNSQSLSCGRLDFHLLDEAGLDNQWVKMPVCKIKQVSPEGVIELDKEFEPSYLNGKDSTLLQSHLREALNLVTHRGNLLAERIAQSGHSSAEFGDFMLLQVLNRHEPKLSYLQQVGYYHPEELFLQLCELQAELSTYNSSKRRADTSLLYQHQHQAGCFRLLINALRNQLTLSLKQHATPITLQQRNHGVQVAPISENALFKEASFILAARASVDSETLRKQLPPQLKVGPVEKIRNLVNLQLPGIQCRVLSVAPRQVPYHGDYCYFSLDLTSNDRAQLEQSGGFAFHIAGEFNDLSLQFWAIRNG